MVQILIIVSALIAIVILSLVYYTDKKTSQEEKNDYEYENKDENSNDKSDEFKDYNLEKAELLNVNCNVCNLNFSTLADKKYYIFYCPRCKTIYEYEKSNKARKINIVRKGKVIPQEFRKEINILGLREEMINQDILNLAWKKKLELYHPDKVAHLAPEIQSLAEEKTKELNEAYNKIKCWIIENNY